MEVHNLEVTHDEGYPKRWRTMKAAQEVAHCTCSMWLREVANHEGYSKRWLTMNAAPRGGSS